MALVHPSCCHVGDPRVQMLKLLILPGLKTLALRKPWDLVTWHRNCPQLKSSFTLLQLSRSKDLNQVYFITFCIHFVFQVEKDAGSSQKIAVQHPTKPQWDLTPGHPNQARLHCWSCLCIHWIWHSLFQKHFESLLQRIKYFLKFCYFLKWG